MFLVGFLSSWCVGFCQTGCVWIGQSDPGFRGPRFSRTQVFADPGFRGPRFSRTQVFADPAIDEFGRRGHRRGFDCVHGGGPKQRSPDENATHETAFRLGPIRLQRLFLALGRIHLFVHTNPPIGFQ